MASYPDTSPKCAIPEPSGRSSTRVEPLTVGLEEEAVLADPVTLAPLPRAADVLERLGGDPRFKLELPAAQLEIVLPPTATVAESARELASARRELAAAAEAVGRAARGRRPPARRRRAARSTRASTTPRSPRSTARSPSCRASARCRCTSRSAATPARSPSTTRCARTSRSWPRSRPTPRTTRARTAAWRPCGRRSPICSRARASRRRSRAGTSSPPRTRWGEAAGALPAPGRWWWELRPHLRHGTLELRVPDAQATVADAAAVAAFAHALVAWLAERHDAGDLPAPDPTWRIEENRWQACRHGLDGAFADLRTGEPAPARELLAERLDAARAQRGRDRLRGRARARARAAARRTAPSASAAPAAPREATVQLLGEYLA